MLAQHPTTSFVATTDLDRAQTFYGETLGLEVVANDGFALICRAAERLIRVVAVQELTPQPFTVLGWEVPDIRQAVIDLDARGIEFKRFQSDQDELGIWTTPSGHRVAWFADPDGNVIAIACPLPVGGNGR